MTTPKLPNPLHQFELQTILPLQVWGIDISLTNGALFMIMSMGLVVMALGFGLRNPKLIPGKGQVAVELAYTFIATMIQDNAGPKAMGFFPLVFCLFFFILMGNMLGMVPYAYTFTSQIIVTFALAALVFITVTVVGFARHGFHFLSLFVPKGLPPLLYPLVVLIEMLSYLSRPITLSVRLFANMMAGHTILKVFAGFSVLLGGYFGWGPLVLTIALTGFEFMVAILQAYVFTVLTCIYLHDAIYLH